MAASARDERLQIMLSPAELELVDNFRFQYRMPSRAAAVRELLHLGLAATQNLSNGQGRKSTEFGVFARGPEGHLRGESDE
jgi:hypothetical protein